MPINVDKDVLWLEVPIKDAPRVEMLNAKDKLSSQESSEALLQELEMIKMLREISVLAVFCEHVEMQWRLRCS